MPSGRFDLADYVQVNERLERFVADYPDGSLQSEIVTLTDSLVVVRAYAYRHPDDPRPGIGHSSLAIPGVTPYTRGSELENAETSAWGRALAALGFEVHRGVASREEVANKRPEPGTQTIVVKRHTPDPAEFVKNVSAWMKSNDLAWNHPAVVAELGQRPAATTVVEIVKGWLERTGGTAENFMSRVEDNVRGEEEPPLEEA